MNEEKRTYPQVSDIEKELKRERYRQKYRISLKNTVFTLVTVSAVAILIATLWLPVLQIYGSSMSPSIEDGQIVISAKAKGCNAGDIIAFYYNNKVLVKRVIALPGQWVRIDEQGNVYVDDVILDEPYVEEKALGQCDIEMPYQVPENKVFVMGDHRTDSIDSRTTVVGCVALDQIVGRIVFGVWPMEKFGKIE